MSNVLILNSSVVHGWRGRVRIIEPSLVVEKEPSVEAAYKRLADKAVELGGNAVIAVGVYGSDRGDPNHSWHYITAYGTVVWLGSRFRPWTG